MTHPLAEKIQKERENLTVDQRKLLGKLDDKLIGLGPTLDEVCEASTGPFTYSDENEHEVSIGVDFNEYHFIDESRRLELGGYSLSDLGIEREPFQNLANGEPYSLNGTSYFPLFGLPAVSEALKNGHYRGAIDDLMGALKVTNKKGEDLTNKEKRFYTFYAFKVGSRIQSALNYEQQKSNARVIEQFTYLAGHDLKTPTIAMGGLIDLVLRKTKIDAQARKWLEESLRGVRNMKGVIAGLMDLAQIGKYEIKSLTVKDVLDSTTMMLGSDLKGKNLEYELSDPELIPKMSATHETYQTLLQSFFMNVFSNAAKYAKEGSKIDYDITTGPGPFFMGSSDKNYLAISVTTYGNSVSKDRIDDVLTKPFEKLPNSSEVQSYKYGLTTLNFLLRSVGGCLSADSGVNEQPYFKLTGIFPLFE
ncbi:sensor histidine kinase [Nanoarchaeota archaeon]